MALKKSVHQIPIYNVIVTGSTVMESWDERGEKETSFFIPDRMAWLQHTFHFALQISGNIFPPQHLKNYVRVTRKCM